MKSRLLFVSFVMMSGLISSASFAAKKPAKKADTPRSDIQVQIPKGELDMSHDSVEVKPPEPLRMEVNLSMWNPHGYSETSYLQNTSDFTAGDMPKVSVNVLTKGWTYPQFHLAPKYGLSFARIDRSGSMNIVGQAVRTSETANISMFRAGLEVAPAAPLFGNLQVTGGASLLPGYVQIARSEFTGGVSRLALSWEQTVALTWWSPKTAALLGAQDMGFELGFENTSALGSSAPTGSGFLGGIRVEM